MFLLIYVKTTFLKHFDCWTKIQELCDGPSWLYLIFQHWLWAHPAHFDCREEFCFFPLVLLWLFLGPCPSLGLPWLWGSILNHETQKCTDHFDSNLYIIYPFLPSFFVPPTHFPSIYLSSPHPSILPPQISQIGMPLCSLGVNDAP